KSQRAGDRLSFYQTNIDDVTQTVHGTAARADEGVARFIVVEVLTPERADRNETVGTGILQLDEQTGARDPGNPALKRRADAVREVMCDQPVGRLALSLHGAPLGKRNLRGDFAQMFRRFAVGQCTFTQSERADQRAVYHQIGIPAYRRCEMRVSSQVEPEMPIILGGIFSLRL